MQNAYDIETAVIAQNTYFDAVKDIPDNIAGPVRKAHDQALAYVWGWQDAKGYDADSSEALAFAAVYGMHTLEFEMGQSSFRRPIVESYRRWRSGERVR